MRLGELHRGELDARLATGRLTIEVGPYTYALHSDIPVVQEGVARLYRDFKLAEPGAYIDYSVGVVHRGVLGRLRGQVEFLFDDKSTFDPFDAAQAYAFLEWGMNWCVSLHTNEYLKLHAAVVARNGCAVIMPGVPGAGKSTLCAALGLSGWRVLSDEHAMIPPHTHAVVPLYRPVSLKNESIAAIRTFCPSVEMGPVSEATHKGVVAHVKADLQQDSHARGELPARAMVFPRFSRDERQRLATRRKTESFILAAYHAFNYSLLCETGFHTMSSLLENVQCYDLVYWDLDWAVQAMEQIPLEPAP